MLVQRKSTDRTNYVKPLIDSCKPRGYYNITLPGNFFLPCQEKKYIPFTAKMIVEKRSTPQKKSILCQKIPERIEDINIFTFDIEWTNSKIPRNSGYINPETKKSAQ